MVDYKELYIHMVDASERALEAVFRQNYIAAAQILVSAEQECEELYIAASSEEE